MLKSIILENFKSIEKINAPLGQLTVLAGLNGSGKSSILQSLAILKQSIDLHADGKRLNLQGRYVNVGKAEDIVYEGANSDAELIIKLVASDEIFEWSCVPHPESDVLETTFAGEPASLKSFFEGFQFIQADRMTPALQYMQATAGDRQNGALGSHGEFSVDFLSRNKEFKVSIGRLNKNKSAISSEASSSKTEADLTNTYLPDAITAWLQILSPGVEPVAEKIDVTESASLRFQYKGYRNVSRDIQGRSHKPTHVGFGLTYVLPILIACLSAPTGSLVLLENPEAHLHPRGQTALGLMLALCANDGVQVVVETHSDHLLNGIRIAAKEKKIKANEVSTLFFTREVETGITTIEQPTLLDNGRFDNWPTGFFDEWGSSLDKLLEP